MSILEFINATKIYNKKIVLDNVSLNIDEGNIIALIGHNGAGKTTMMKLLLGLIIPSSGFVRVLGLDPANPDNIKIKYNLGFLPETVMFKHGMTGLGTLNFFSRLKQTNLTNNIKLLERVGLADVSGQNVKTYSKGMIQRLGLAQALLGSPRILLLDEPTTGLDPVLRHEFYNILSDLKARGVTILLSSHALPELENRVDKLIIMNMGKIVANGSLYELRQKARIPIRIRLKTKNKSTNSMAKKLKLNESTYVNGKTIEFTCLPEEKMIFLRRASKIGVDLEDLEVELPSLYQLYAYYQNEVRI